MKAYFEYGIVSSSFVGHTRTERFVQNREKSLVIRKELYSFRFTLSKCLMTLSNN